MEILNQPISAYLDGLVPPRHPVLAEMEEVAQRSKFPIIGPACGHLCYLLTRLTGAVSRTVRSDRRPVPLDFEYSETPLAERIAGLLATQGAPVYLVHFTQRAATEAAQALMSLAICTKEEKAVLATELERMKFNSPFGRDLKRWLRHGIRNGGLSCDSCDSAVP